MENRLIELETRLAFQDDTLQELNKVVIRQQQEIDRLRQDVAALRSQIQTLSPDPGGHRGSEPPPPHY